ncbi:hypothetical protein IMG5_174420 [Ichthyophthirius multifiliis]|uniref:Protein FAM221A n=1 Tax=Ichthyophthirius multifiliis TaxID=5932 RepID=G0R224_ICHMU|nr:hypothetical protein IMG5_174420 [Ichthyophthirius multifiliis]EGR28488.1 hypothetical protein IMG5_174420 [Ichthyophthirius multifiliis]|eukprot:XP_004029724.1 hypothetical protein IMG5_174420 [Ichthyophthirius multifiliis]
MAERLVINSNQAKHVQAYLEYQQFVGGYDNGKLMSEQEFEEFKQNYREKAKNRVYCVWKNSLGLDCKVVGPQSKCFCDHRFKDHEYLQPKDKSNVNCREGGCKCKCFQYVPIYGSQDFKCSCKHSYLDHQNLKKTCSKCKACSQFTSTLACSCGQKYSDHITVFETRQERIKMGKPVDDLNNVTPELGLPVNTGGLTSFQVIIIQLRFLFNLYIRKQQLAVGADRYEQMIDNLGKNAIGSDIQKGMIKGQNNLMLQNGQQQQQIQQDNNGQLMKCGQQEVSAFQLFCTPHQFMRVQATGKGFKAIKK